MKLLLLIIKNGGKMNTAEELERYFQCKDCGEVFHEGDLDCDLCPICGGELEDYDI